MTAPSVKSGIQSGFTLVEVVVALAIVGMGVVTLFEIFSSGLRLETRSSGRTEVAAYSRQAIDGFLIRREVRDGRLEGSMNERYRWGIEVQPFREDDQLSSVGWDLKEITVEMRYREEGRDKRTELKTLRLVKKGR